MLKENLEMRVAIFIFMAMLIFVSYATRTAQTRADHRMASAAEKLAEETRKNTKATADLARVLECQTSGNCRHTKKGGEL